MGRRSRGDRPIGRCEISWGQLLSLTERIAFGMGRGDSKLGRRF